MDQINHIQFVLRAFVGRGEDPAKRLSQTRWEGDVAALDVDAPEARKLAVFFAARKTVIDPTLVLREMLGRTHQELVAVEPGLGKLRRRWPPCTLRRERRRRARRRSTRSSTMQMGHSRLQ